MLKGDYFYNATIKKAVAVFGTVFNDIHVAKIVSGKLTKVSRVPLAYGPRQKFIERIRKRDEASDGGVKVAIKVPRMSFEITSLTYDATAKLNANNRTILQGIDSNEIAHYRPFYEGVPYRLGMQLNIMSTNQDDVLQILEQILPSFTPEYTVSVLNMNGPGRSLDVPILLTSNAISDDYEQEMSTGHRLIVYTLEFELKIKFTGDQSVPTGDNGRKVIKYVTIKLHDSLGLDSVATDAVDVRLGDMVNDTPESYTVVTTYGFVDEEPPDEPVV
jgi:hypothetical protein